MLGWILTFIIIAIGVAVIALRSIVSLFIVLPFIVVVGACRAASSRYVPTGQAVGAGPSGQSAAFYEYVSPDPRRGQFQIWCDGPRSAGFQLGLRFRNDSKAPVVFSPSMSTLAYPDMEPDMRPREKADVAIAAGRSSDLLVHFPYPARFRDRLPSDVTFTWVVKADGKIFREATRFSVETGRGFVPRPLDTSATEPPDRQDTDRPRGASPVGIPVGPDETRSR